MSSFFKTNGIVPFSLYFLLKKETSPKNFLTLGQVLAERVVAKENVPEVRTSIKDGYAVLGISFILGMTFLLST